MRVFEDENYYQILQVAPNAGIDDIKRAYREALAIYEEESVVTYTLFSDDQREALLQTIEAAFGTLISEGKRATYNQMLMETGQVDATAFSRRGQRMLSAHSATGNPSEEKSLRQWIQKKINEPEIKALIEEIHSNTLLSGQHLKQLRCAYGVDIPEVYAITKISSDTLRKIEANQYANLPAAIYLKQFLRTYAEILNIDSQHVAESYLKTMALDQPAS